MTATSFGAPATFGLDDGFWFPIRHAIGALLGADERRMAMTYVVCEEASQYYRVMCKARRMPVLIREWLGRGGVGSLAHPTCVPTQLSRRKHSPGCTPSSNGR